MAFSLVQAGTALKLVDSAGTLTSLTLPTGATLDPNTFARWAVYQDQAILVNTPTFPLAIDATGTVRPLSPKAPSLAPIVSAGASGALTGTYSGVRVTFLVKDADGALLSESDYSPASNSVTITGQALKVTGIPLSSEVISSRRIYRTVAGGTTLFPWLEVEGNTITEVQDDLPDLGLSALGARILGTPPRLTLIKEWRDRLWGVGDEELDVLRYSEALTAYAWPSENSIEVPGVGRDKWGIRGLMPRREALGIARRDIIFQLTGHTIDDFQIIKLSENTGLESQESMVVYRDTVFWLWKDGVYQWDGNGIRNISDKSVGSWFNTNSYFNQDMFPYSFAVFDPVRYKYRLYLASAGSTQIDRWVEYDVTTSTWWGPHKTAAFNPTSAFVLVDDGDKTSTATGSSAGYVWHEQATQADDTSTAIYTKATTRAFDGGLADYDKYWGQLSMVGKVQSAGQLTITPKVGYLPSATLSPITYDMTRGRQRLQRLGAGKTMQLSFSHNVAGEGVELYGFELPYHVIGHR